MNKFEEIKAEKDGLEIWPDIERYAREGYDSISDDDKVRMKWYGVFFRRHIPGFFMLRIRIPNGIATSEQIRTIASIASDFARGQVDITTRQQFQIRWYRIESVPEMVARLAAVGVDTRQTGMDNIRNVMGCALAGATTHELFDASPIVRDFTSRFVGNKEFSNLPRKFNVAITGCIDNCVPLETQDIAMSPAVKLIEGQLIPGLNAMVGGKSGSGGFTSAQPLDVFVRPEEAAELAAQIVLLFRDCGPRETRSRVRLAFLIEDWGMERFRAELESRIGHSLERAGQDARGSHRTDHIAIAPEHELGVYSLGLSVPIGRLTSDQLMKVADLADRYGRGEIRLTHDQNIILPHIVDRHLPWLLNEPFLQELRPDPTPAVRGTVSCTGLGTCDLALAETKELSLEVARRADSATRFDRPIAIAWSGCPAGCANHQVADIGVQGDQARVDGNVIPVYHVYVGGRLGCGARAGVRVLSQIPAERIGSVVEELSRAHAERRDLTAAAHRIAAGMGKAPEEPELVPVA
jgi:ferredoxin-nitrite reductase